MEIFQKHDLRVKIWRSGFANVIVDLENYGKSFLAVRGINVNDGQNTRSQLVDPVIVDGLWFGEPGKKRFSVAVPRNMRVVGLTVQDEITGAILSNYKISLSDGKGPAPELTSPQETPSVEIALENTHAEGSKVTFGPGHVVLDRTLEIPSSHEVVFAPGLGLALEEGVSLIVYGDLTSIGTEMSPIKIFGADSQKDWGKPSLVLINQDQLQLWYRCAGTY